MGRLHAHVRPHVRAHVRSPLSGSAGGLSVHDGISFTASNGRVVIKAPGAAPTITTLTSAFTFTGGNQSMYRGGSGLLIASATNTPRIEYGPGGDVYGLLMEASRTNLALQSQDYSTSHSLAALLAFGAGSVANATTAPDGTVTADKLVEDTTTTLHRIRQTTDVTIASGDFVSFSCWVKAAERTKCRLRITESTFASAYEVSFNLASGTIGTATTTGVAVGVGSTMTPYANGWYRLSISAAINGGFLTCRTNLELEDASGSNAYTGDGVSGLYAWGEQIEIGKFPSSYIPTTTVSVARTADSCIRTLSTEFSATAGAVVVAGRASGGQDAAGNQNVYSFDDTTVANRIQLTRVQATDTARYIVSTASVAQATLDATFVNSTAYKHAAAWTANDYASSLNGAAVLTDAAGTIPTVTVLGLGVLGAGGSVANGHIRTFDYYPVRQPNEFLVARST